MGCGDKRKHTCGKKMKAVCVYYEGFIPKDSDLHEEDCVTLFDTTEDLYNTTEDIKQEINLEELGLTCIDYEEEEIGEIKVNEALLKHEELICELKELLGNSEGVSSNSNGITDWKLDTKCLVDRCDTGFKTLEDLLQAIIDKLCTCCKDNQTGQDPKERVFDEGYRS